ncbi:MAG: hypothetical protein IPI59_13785 [Sphingobacteriales bacterium]|nr:hypothetical protein [Sphingobacteriales bacterium]MBP9141977.1 hypothetical protein [Chitinophagales bacterium]MDA0198967.1 hypothetical protein [Bacteroidota bacterium]
MFYLLLPDKTMPTRPPQLLIEGVYVLTGQREMAAAFNFHPNGQFEFFFSYGAADRQASGSYTVEGNTLKLQGNKIAGSDFTVTKQAYHANKNGSTIVINAPKIQLVSGVVLGFCQINTQTTTITELSNNKGIIYFDAPNCENLYLQHQIFPDVATQIKDSTNNNNYFEVELNQSVLELSFKGIDFTIQGDTLTCLPNYFMPFENIRACLNFIF